MSQSVPTMIPMQVLEEVDNSRNPMSLTKERIERAATENQFMNGKIQAIQACIYFDRVVSLPHDISVTSRTATILTKQWPSRFRNWRNI